MRRVLAVGGIAAVGLLLIAAVAAAHVERTAYWPDPRPDAAVTPPAGGQVPHARSLASALKKNQVGETRVVCKRNTPARVKRDIRAARHGYTIRPSQPELRISKKRAKKLRRI